MDTEEASRVVAARLLQEAVEASERQAELARQVVRARVLDARAAGLTWAQIGAISGISAQAAHQRWASAAAC